MSKFIWKKSTRSNGSANCVEVATNLQTVVGVRDSKDPQGPAFSLAPDAWSAFIESLSRGSFDL